MYTVTSKFLDHSRKRTSSERGSCKNFDNIYEKLIWIHSFPEFDGKRAKMTI